ncbi:MAG TPA: CvpA family protein [Alphaproteobacteria bacterium]|nr:CvpA family protein [Alphaproteobacteria bacterium]
MEPHTGLNNLDYVVLGIIGLSAIFALFRGFVREVLSLISWILAYFAAVRYHSLLEPFVHRYIKNESLLMPIAATGVFVLTLVLLSLLSTFITGLVRGKALTAVDRSLGFLFGIARGALIICIVYMALVSVFWPELEKTPEQIAKTADEDKSPNKPPEWLMEAKTRPAMAYGSHMLKDVIPRDDLEKTVKGFQDSISKQYAKKKDEVQKAADQQALDTLSTPVPAATSAPAAAPTYDNQSRNGLNNLVNQKGGQ